MEKKSEAIETQVPKGHLHPITSLIREIQTIFAELGFAIAQGPEAETEFYNFDALNIPADHPARDMQDTFWLKTPERKVMRTHTSPVQVRYMETHKPPLRIVVPGKVFRNEATDATHEAQFYQVEGLLIDKNVSMAQLRGTLDYFFKRLLGPDVTVRFQPSYFPFTEPSAEIFISCFKCKGAGCAICKRSGWIEVMGAGRVHEHVLRSSGLDPKEWSGFAFGGGIDRLLMLKYGVEDVRHFYNGDLRIVNQF